MQCVRMGITESTVRKTADNARTNHRAVLRMDTVLTAANCGTLRMFAKNTYVSKTYVLGTNMM